MAGGRLERWSGGAELAAIYLRGGGSKGFVEVGAKTLCKGATQEFEHANALTLAFLVGRGANSPAMQV